MASQSRRLILIAVGNPVRGDDGVAGHVLQQLGPGEYDTRTVLQLTPELAEEIARYETVVFLDADAGAERVSIEPSATATGISPLTHAAHVAEIEALARSLYGFTGRVLLCRIPAVEFSPGEGLSDSAQAAAREAVRQLEEI